MPILLIRANCPMEAPPAAAAAAAAPAANAPVPGAKLRIYGPRIVRFGKLDRSVLPSFSE